MGRFEGIEICKTSDPKWNEMISRLPIEKQDIYYSAEYYRSFERITGMSAEMFCFMQGSDLGIYPYLKTEIRRDYLTHPYYDIETVYGYGGPLAVSSDQRFCRVFEERFEEYCRDNDIVAEFIRFHPILANEHIFSNLDVIHNRVTVMVDLTLSEDDIWTKELTSGNRNVIRKCIKNGLTVIESDDYDTFYEIYKETMDKVGAESFYYLDREFFEEMKKDDHYHLLVCVSNEEIIAAAVFMGYGDYFHYHFAGSRKESLSLSPNNILLWEAIKFAKEHGYKKMHLGGGLTDSEEDSLFRFKARYSRIYRDFYIGKRVHNEVVYRKLISDWEKKHGINATRLLQYKE